MGGKVTPVQLFRQFYMDGEFSIFSRSTEDGGSARIYRGTWWQRHGCEPSQVSTLHMHDCLLIFAQ